jgi:hypothetical protein
MHGKFDVKNLGLTLGGGLVKSDDPILRVKRNPTPNAKFHHNNQVLQ